MGVFSKVTGEEKPKSVFELVQGNAEGQYSELLGRAMDPKQGDEDALLKLLPVLGIDLRAARNDLAVLKQAKDLQNTLDAAKAAEDRIAKIRPDLDKLQKQYNDFVAKSQPPINVLIAELNQQNNIAQQQHEARGVLNEMKQRNPRAFGLKPQAQQPKQ